MEKNSEVWHTIVEDNLQNTFLQIKDIWKQSSITVRREKSKMTFNPKNNRTFIKENNGQKYKIIIINNGDGKEV